MGNVITVGYLSFSTGTRKHSPVVPCKHIQSHNHLDLLGLGRDRLLVGGDGALGGDAETALDVFGLLLGAEVAGGEKVELLLLLVGIVVDDVEEDTDDEGNDGDGTVVPHKVRVVGEGSESLGDGGGEGSGKALHTHDQRPHVLGGLGVRILEGGHGGEDLRDGDKDVDTGHGPDVDWRRVVGVVGLVVARGLVHVVLENSSPQHGESTEEETSSDLLDGGEVDLVLAEEGVDVQIKDWPLVSECTKSRFRFRLTRNEDNESDGVHVLQKIVGGSVKSHGSAHGSQVVVHLAVGKPVDGHPHEYTASTETTADFVNPGVIESVPLGLVGTESRGLDLLPSVTLLPVLDGLDGVGSDTVTKSLEEQLDSRSEHTSGRRCKLVLRLAENQDGDGEEEEDEGNQEGQVETDVTFSEDHAKLASKGTPVDEPVEPVVNTGGGDGRVDNDKLAVAILNTKRVVGQLLHDERRNIGLEGTRSKTSDEQTENEDTQRSVGLIHDGRCSRDDEDGVTDFSDEDRVEDGLVATEVLVGNPGTEQRADVDPERVEGGQGEGNLLAQAKGTGLGGVAGRVDGGTSAGSGALALCVELTLVDEVGVDDDSAIVRHALAQFDEANGEDLQGDLLGNTTQSAHLLLGGEVIAIAGEVAVLESSLSLGDEVCWRAVGVSLRMLALWVAGTIQEGAVQGGGLLGGGQCVLYEAVTMPVVDIKGKGPTMTDSSPTGMVTVACRGR